MRRTRATIIAVLCGCTGESIGSEDSATVTTMDADASSGPDGEAETTGAVDPDSTSGESTSDPGDATSSAEADTGQPETSTGTAGLDPRVSWDDLLERATAVAAGINPQAELSLITMTGVQADGSVDLSDVDADGEIELRFWQVGADTGVSVRYSVSSFDPAAEDYEANANPVNGNAFESAPLWSIESLPSGPAVADGFAAAPGCGGFGGQPDDSMMIAVDRFTESVIEIRAANATTNTTAIWEAGSLEFPPCG